jgi:hypothetical protein
VISADILFNMDVLSRMVVMDDESHTIFNMAKEGYP